MCFEKLIFPKERNPQRIEIESPSTRGVIRYIILLFAVAEAFSCRKGDHFFQDTGGSTSFDLELTGWNQ